MNIGLFGGTFDPVHQGHIALAKAALTAGFLDRLIIMPAGQPPHKKGQVVSMAGYRYEMCCQAFSGHPQIEVSDLEILRSGPSYTLDTIRQLRQQLPAGAEIFLVYGSDILNDIEKWHRPAEIMAECDLLLGVRGGLSQTASEAKADDLRMRYGARITFFTAPVIELSSTSIREAVIAGHSYQAWLPEKVARIISKHKLYLYQADWMAVSKQLSDQLNALERQIWPLLDRKRLLHSLNVTAYALHLARLHQVDLTQAGIAALLHDCAKCLSRRETLEYAKQMGDEALLEHELAHGPAGAWLARERFGIADPAILRAIHYHTTACPGMTSLDKIIFIADKAEPARTYDNLDEIRQLVEYDLDAALKICLSEINLFLKREKLKPHPYTQLAQAELEQVTSYKQQVTSND